MKLVLPSFRVISARANGNCFFESVSNILKSSLADNQQSLICQLQHHQHTQELFIADRYHQQLFQKLMEAQDLRKKVAAQIVSPSKPKVEKLVIGALDFWLTFVCIEKLEELYDLHTNTFLQPLKEWYAMNGKQQGIKQITELDQIPFNIRQQISSLMCNPAYYWADQFAIEILAALMDINIVVIDATKAIKYSTNTNWSEQYCMILFKSGEHYDWIQF